MENEIIDLKQLYDILPFGKSKIQKLIKAGELPVLKVGKDYITTKKKLFEWIESNIGEELFY